MPRRDRRPAPAGRLRRASSARPCRRDCCASRWRRPVPQIPVPSTKRRPGPPDYCKKAPCLEAAAHRPSPMRARRWECTPPISDADSRRNAAKRAAKAPNATAPGTPDAGPKLRNRLTPGVARVPRQSSYRSARSWQRPCAPAIGGSSKTNRAVLQIPPAGSA